MLRLLTCPRCGLTLGLERQTSEGPRWVLSHKRRVAVVPALDYIRCDRCGAVATLPTCAHVAPEAVAP